MYLNSSAKVPGSQSFPRFSGRFHNVPIELQHSESVIANWIGTCSVRLLETYTHSTMPLIVPIFIIDDSVSCVHTNSSAALCCAEFGPSRLRENSSNSSSPFAKTG